MDDSASEDVRAIFFDLLNTDKADLILFWLQQPLWERVDKIKPSVDDNVPPRPWSPGSLVVYERLTPVAPIKPPPTRQKVRSKTVWIKGTFRRNITNDEVEAFIRQIFEPLGKMLVFLCVCIRGLFLEADMTRIDRQFFSQVSRPPTRSD
jgi:hypothetical protein